MNEDFQLFLNQLPSTNEKDIITLMNLFIAKHGSSLFIDYTTNAQINFTIDSLEIKNATLLNFSILCGHIELVCKLLSLGVGLDQSKSPPTLSDVKSLFFACHRDNLEMVKILLDYTQELLATHDSRTILMYTKSMAVFDLLLTKSFEIGCLAQLISIKDKHNYTVFDWLCHHGRSNELRKLIEIENFHLYTDIHSLLHYARTMYFKSPTKHHDFDEICSRLIPFYNHEIRPTLTFDENRDQMDTSKSGMFLYHRHTCLDPSPKSKQEAIQKAITQFYSLLSTPASCVNYLQLINSELLRYYQQKHGTEFPALDRTTVRFERINGIAYPIPTDDYMGISKHSALQEFLILHLRQYGLSEQSYKWINFIPHDIADTMISRGDFTVECRFGTGLFHTKLAHMLQISLLIYLIQDNKVMLNYTVQGAGHQISVQDILHALLSTPSRQKPHKLWADVLDCFTTNSVTLADPLRLGSMIMLQAEHWNIQALSNHLLDTFCKGLRRLVLAFNDESRPLEGLTIAEFVKKISETNLQQFGAIHLFNYILKREENRAPNQKNSLFIIDTQKKYAIFQKKYNLNLFFKPLRINPNGNNDDKMSSNGLSPHSGQYSFGSKGTELGSNGIPFLYADDHLRGQEDRTAPGQR